LATTFYGSVKTAGTVWAMGDLGMGAMAWVNLTAIFFLTKTALKVLKDYEMQKKAGIDPVFKPLKLGIKGADFWEEEYVGTDHTIQKEEYIDTDHTIQKEDKNCITIGIVKCHGNDNQIIGADVFL
jgi:AGCS family alanine or glycine:cation symporter